MRAILPTTPAHELDERFQKTCRDRRSSVAVRNLTDGRALTFGDLFDQYGDIGRVLHELRFGPGSAIVTRVGNHPAFFPILAACLTAGAAVVALGEATDEETASAVANCGAAALVTDRPPAAAALERRAIGDGISIDALARTADAPAYGESVVLKLTSGSTDVPKAAIAGVRHLVNDGRHVIDAMGIGPRDVNLACIPLSHSYALGNIVMPLLLQGTAVALRQSFHPLQFVDDAARTGATVFPGVPFMFQQVRAVGVERLPRDLRLLITAGARIDPATVGWFYERLGIKVHSFYGSSETGGICYDDSDEVADPLDVGRAMPETTVEVRDPDASGTGRIFVKGSAVAPEYASRAGADPDSGFADGGFITSDIGRFGAGGRLVLTGRVSPLVNVAGRKVDPGEIERRLADMPGIVDARVIGASCDRRGQQLVAFVVSDCGLTSMALRQRCAKLLSPHKIPRRFVFLDRLPVDARGKIDRRALEALAMAEPA